MIRSVLKSEKLNKVLRRGGAKSIWIFNTMLISSSANNYTYQLTIFLQKQIEGRNLQLWALMEKAKETVLRCISIFVGLRITKFQYDHIHPSVPKRKLTDIYNKN